MGKLKKRGKYNQVCLPDFLNERNILSQGSDTLQTQTVHFVPLETETWVVNKPKIGCEALSNSNIKSYDRNHFFQREKWGVGTTWYS